MFTCEAFNSSFGSNTKINTIEINAIIIDFTDSPDSRHVLLIN